ncbi:nucleotidyltransferase family protein [Brevundimonas sp.]|uniref:nucleotidyltransferase family protein n=1 Tax=Brevundimonas sp. TaxID=1871086 RepID=UPI002896F79F|nr:nucleotidyltransferase family protein [Brevundimonas sp.]
MMSRAGRHALVLAAGAGRRFGGNKLSALWGGEPLVLAALRTALAARVERVTVVTGAQAPALDPVLSTIDDPRLRRVVALDWNEGLAASLRAGVASLPGDTQGAVIFLGDMPLIPAGLADQLLDAVAGGAPAARVRSPRGPAHPVAFAAAVFPDLVALVGDRGARSVMDGLGEAVACVDSDAPGVVFDVDLPSDLDKATIDEPT